MNTYFMTTDTVFSITEQYPETIDVFVSNGFTPMKNAAMRAKFGKMITLEGALKMKNLNPQTFVSLLNDAIEGKRNHADTTLADSETTDTNGTQVVGLLPCPVRIPLMEQYNEFITTGNFSGINTQLKAASVGTDWVRDNLTGIDDAAELPDLFMSAGFDLFFDMEKIGQFRSQGVFSDLVDYQKENPWFAGYNMKDPSGNYSVISVVPAIFLVNTDELNGREMPRSWADLLEPEWEQSLSLPMADLDLFNAILLNIHNLYGDEGVQKLGRSMLSAMHPAQMVKTIHAKQNRPAVTIMPYFFTKTLKEGSSMVEAVWPEDGAIISPVFMLAKKTQAETLQPVVDFFASKAVGETLANQGFPSLHPEVDNHLPEGTPMMWLGWDYILQTDLSAQIERCKQIFSMSSGDKNS